MESKPVIEWRPVVGFEGLYEVSNEGKVRSLKKNTSILLSPANVNGYHRVLLSIGGRRCNLFVHRIVAHAFIEKPEGKDYINHKNGNKMDNTVVNLEWCTLTENNHHAIRTGLKKASNPEYRKSVIATNINTQEEFEFNSLTEAATFIGEKTAGSISSFFKGERAHVKGFVFRKSSGSIMETVKLYERIISICKSTIKTITS